MDWITSEIAIGDCREAQDCSLLRQQGINSIWGLISTLRGKSPAEMGVSRIEVLEILDGPGNAPARFLRVVGLLDELVKLHAPVLVHCRAGWSRSPAVVARYLMQSQQLSAADAMALVAAQRKI